MTEATAGAGQPGYLYKQADGTIRGAFFPPRWGVAAFDASHFAPALGPRISRQYTWFKDVAPGWYAVTGAYYGAFVLLTDRPKPLVPAAELARLAKTLEAPLKPYRVGDPGVSGREEHERRVVAAQHAKRQQTRARYDWLKAAVHETAEAVTEAVSLADLEAELARLQADPGRWGEARPFAGKRAGLKLQRMDVLRRRIAALKAGTKATAPRLTDPVLRAAWQQVEPAYRAIEGGKHVLRTRGGVAYVLARYAKIPGDTFALEDLTPAQRAKVGQWLGVAEDVAEAAAAPANLDPEDKAIVIGILRYGQEFGDTGPDLAGMLDGNPSPRRVLAVAKKYAGIPFQGGTIKYELAAKARSWADTVGPGVKNPRLGHGAAEPARIVVTRNAAQQVWWKKAKTGPPKTEALDEAAALFPPAKAWAVIQANLPALKGWQIRHREIRKGLSIRQWNPRAVAIEVAHAGVEDIAGLTAQLAALFQGKGYDTKYPSDSPAGGALLVALKLTPKAEAAVGGQHFHHGWKLTSGEGGTPAAEAAKLKPGDVVTINGIKVEVATVRSQQRTVPLFHPTDPQGKSKTATRQIVSVVGIMEWLQRTKFTFYGPKPTYEGADYAEAEAPPPVPRTPEIQQATAALIDAIVTATEQAARTIAREKEASFEARTQPKFRAALAEEIAEAIEEEWARWTRTPEARRANRARASTTGRGLLDDDRVSHAFQAVHFEPRYGGFGPRSLSAHFAKLPTSPWHRPNVALARAVLGALPAHDTVSEDIMWDRIVTHPLTVAMYLLGPDKDRGHEIVAALAKSPDVRATVRDASRGLLDVSFDTAKFASGWDLRVKEFLTAHLFQRLHAQGIRVQSRRPIMRLPAPAAGKTATEATTSAGVGGFRLGHVGTVARPIPLPFPGLHKRRRVPSRV